MQRAKTLRKNNWEARSENVFVKRIGSSKSIEDGLKNRLGKIPGVDIVETTDRMIFRANLNELPLPSKEDEEKLESIKQSVDEKSKRGFEECLQNPQAINENVTEPTTREVK